MSCFKKFLTIILTIFIMVTCCACGTTSSIQGLYRCGNKDDVYLLFRDDGKCSIYTYTYSTPNTFYTYNYYEVETKGNTVKLVYPGYEDWAQTFTVEKTTEGFTLTSTSSSTVYQLQKVDIENVTFDDTMTYMTIKTGDVVGDNTEVSVNENVSNLPEDESSVEMNTHYPIYTSKYPVKDGYVTADEFTQDIANKVELAYEDFLLDVVFKDDDIDWTADIDYTWSLNIYDTGVFVIDVRVIVPNADYGYMKHEITSVITFDEYGYWEVSNFDMQSCPVD